jgi:hypothetical protein
MTRERHNDRPQRYQRHGAGVDGPAQARAAEGPGQARAKQPEEAPAPAPARPLDAVEEPMKCVWSGYPDSDRSCRSRIPASVVVKAWQRETQLKGTVEGFFYFAWRSGVWLAFGVKDGGVRGVYCPTHCSERDSRDAPGEVPADHTDRPPGDRRIRRTAAARAGGAAQAARLSAVPG